MSGESFALEQLRKIRVVLVATTHPGNIGAAARAMKTMGLEDLVLVQPKHFPCAEATERAAGADDILARAKVVASLEQALEDVSFVLGASARLRTFRWPGIDPRQAAQQSLETVAQGGSVALVFGRESSGLSNEELERCHKLVHIPVNEAYGSLNLAAAVQVLAYELRMACVSGLPAQVQDHSGETEATVAQMSGLIEHLEQTLTAIGYLDPDNPRKLMPRIRRFFYRARPSENEVNLLRGILKKILEKNGPAY